MQVLKCVLLLLTIEVYHIYEVYTIAKSTERRCEFVRKIQGSFGEK